MAGITGTLSAATGASQINVPFVADGDTRFTLPVGDGEALHDVSVGVRIEASLSIPMPPMIVLTHHPERTEQVTETVHLYRPGASDFDSDSQTITVTHDDGTTTDHTVSASAYAHVPATTITKQVAVEVLHQGARQGRGGGAATHHEDQDRNPHPCLGRGIGRPLRDLGAAGARAGGPARRAGAGGRPRRLVPHPGMGVAVVKRLLMAMLLAGAALAITGAAPAEEQAMLEAFDRVLTAMAYAAAGLAVFAIVWAGFVLMAGGPDDRGGGRARSAVVMAVVGLVLVLLAKGVAALLSSGLVPFPAP